MMMLFCCLKVTNLLAIELAYVNTKHPDFSEAQLMYKSYTENAVDMSSLQVSNPRDSELPAKVSHFFLQFHSD